MSDDKPHDDAKPPRPWRKLREGETVGVFNYVGSNKRGPGGPLPQSERRCSSAPSRARS